MTKKRKQFYLRVINKVTLFNIYNTKGNLISSNQKHFIVSLRSINLNYLEVSLSFFSFSSSLLIASIISFLSNKPVNITFSVSL